MSQDYDFTSLLDTLAGEPDEPGPTVRAPFSFDHLAMTENLHASASPVPDSVAVAEYAEALEPVEEAAPDPEAVPVTPPPVDPETVAAELDLSRLDAVGLAALRKDFARRNHPDCVPPAIRAAALERMQLANAMIDAAEKRLAR